MHERLKKKEEDKIGEEEDVEKMREELEEERAELEREKEEWKGERERWMRQAIETGMRRERLEVAEEARAAEEAKWRKRLEEADSWWRSRNREVKQEWEEEREEWERQKEMSAKEMEEERAETERLRADLEEERRKWEWQREAESSTGSKEEGATKESGTQDETAMNILLDDHETEINKLKEDLQTNEESLYKLQRTLTAITSRHEDEKKERSIHNHQIGMSKSSHDEYTKNSLIFEMKELEFKEKELIVLLKELNELQRCALTGVRRLSEDRRDLCSRWATHQRHAIWEPNAEEEIEANSGQCGGQGGDVAKEELKAGNRVEGESEGRNSQRWWDTRESAGMHGKGFLSSMLEARMAQMKENYERESIRMREKMEEIRQMIRQFLHPSKNRRCRGSTYFKGSAAKEEVLRPCNVD
ncbi:vicilin-like seed storage protein At2g18540 [Ischnura elegans]|uniref:vicilin-like seed storage protein At2g18540 n=1 Tax=Ischnura elegans TaxID=197161 RepID=UPI001ED8A48F|nr:vicilin-like seed storage protein At2g18540 [Ischnura elegans]